MKEEAKVLKIRQLMDYYNFNQGEFADYTTVHPVSLSKILNGNRTCGDSVRSKILLAFDKINPAWFDGESDEMFKPGTVANSGDITITGNQNSSISNVGHGNTYTSPASSSQYSNLPAIVEVECPSCGNVIEVASDVILPAIPQEITRMPNIDLEQFMANHPQEMEEIDLRYIWGKGVFVVEVDTRAMEPEYRQGTRLVLRKLPGLAYARPDGSAYVIDTMLPHTLFRYFSKERDGSYKLSASRESGRDPLWLQESDIQHVYDIVGSFRIGR